MKKCRLVLTLVFCCINSFINTMDNTQLYVKVADGVLTSFDKSILPAIKTLRSMKDDFPEAGESLDNPFPLSTLSLDNFNAVVNLIYEMKVFFPNKRPTGKDLYEYFWGIFRSKSNRYTLLKNIIETADFLDVDPFIQKALFACIYKPLHEKSFVLSDSSGLIPETIDYALTAGLQKVNTLSDTLLNTIKKPLIEYVFNKSYAKLYYYGLPRRKMTIMLDQNELVKNNNDLHESSMALSVNDFSDDGTIFISLLNKNIYQFALYDINNNDISNKRIYDLKWIVNILPNFIGNLSNPTSVWYSWYTSHSEDWQKAFKQDVPKTTNEWDHFCKKSSKTIKISPDKEYVCFSFQQFVVETDSIFEGISVIVHLKTNNTLLIPIPIGFFSNYTDPITKQKNLIGISNTDKTPTTFILIDTSLKVKSTYPQKDKFLRNALIIDNMVIFSGYKRINKDGIYNFTDDYMDIEGEAYLTIFDILSNKLFECPLTEIKEAPYIEAFHKDMQAFVEKNNVLTIIGNSHDIGFIHRIIIGKDVQNQRTIQQFSVEKLPEIISTLDQHKYYNADTFDIITGLVPYPFNRLMSTSDVKDKRIRKRIIEQKDSLKLIVYNPEKHAIEIEELLSSNTIQRINNIYNSAFNFSIEQLHMLADIVYRLKTNRFKGMTPLEKELFEQLDLEFQNLFHSIFSQNKPINDYNEVISIINVKKASEQEATLKGYITPSTSSTKRAAPDGDASDTPPAKKQRTDNAKSSDEESTDETTLNESDDDV